MRIAPVLFLLALLCAGQLFCQPNYYKAKVFLKEGHLEKIKFYAFDNRDDVILKKLEVDNPDSKWEIYGGQDGRLMKKNRKGESLWALEFGQEYVEIKEGPEEVASQYPWMLDDGVDTLFIKLPQVTRDQSSELFLSGIYKKYRIEGDEKVGLQSMQGVEDILSYRQLKPKNLHLEISVAIANCSGTVQLGGAFISILEMHRRESLNR